MRSHCMKRMRERGIDALDLQRILKNAVVVRDGYRRNGEWRYRVMERSGNAPPRRKNIEVVVVIMSEVLVHAQTTYRKRKG